MLNNNKSSNEKEEKSLKSIKAILDMSEEDIKRKKLEKKCNYYDQTSSSSDNINSNKEQHNNDNNMNELLREIFTSNIDNNNNEEEDDDDYDDDYESGGSSYESNSSIDNSSVEEEKEENATTSNTTPNKNDKSLLELGVVLTKKEDNKINILKNISFSKKNYILTSPLGIRIQQHQNKMKNKNNNYSTSTSSSTPLSNSSPTSTKSLMHNNNTNNDDDDILDILTSKDFLRIPSTYAIRIQNPKIKNKNVNTKEFVLLSKLQNDVIKVSNMQDIFTKVIIRDKQIGLGMTIHEKKGHIQIHALVCQDTTRVHYSPSDTELDIAFRTGNAGPAQLAGIRPCDRIIGVNGKPLLILNQQGSKSDDSVVMLKNAVRAIMNTPDPVVIHLRRINQNNKQNNDNENNFENDNIDDDDDSHNVTTMTTLMTVPDLLDSDNEITNINNNKLSSNNNNNNNADKLPQDNKIEKEVSIKRGGGKNSNHNIVLSSKKTNTSVTIHTLAKAFTSRLILRTPTKDESIVTIQLKQFTDRAEQWESTSFIRFDPVSKALKPIVDKSDLPYSDTPYKIPSVYAPSIPSPSFSRLDSIQYYNTTSNSSNNSSRRNVIPNNNNNQDVFLNLGHVRKALCIRIMHSFQDGDRTAYTIWVYDVESGKEWYAPVRYYRDFQDLRNATCRIYPFLSQIPFPSSSHWGTGSGIAAAFWSSTTSSSSTTINATSNTNNKYNNDNNTSNNTNSAHYATATNIISSPTLKLLEIFLRSLCSMLYTGTLHPRSAEVAIHLQSFLGCDVCFSKEESTGITYEDVFLQKNKILLPKPISSHRLSVIDVSNNNNNASSSAKKNERDIVKMYLKRSIQRYIHRVFLLPVLEQLITKFIDDFKSTTSTNFSTNITSSSTTTTDSSNNNEQKQKQQQQQDEFKEEAQKAIDNVSNFLDQMQDLLWEGCKEDLLLLSKRREYSIIQDELDHIKSTSNRETFLQEGIREQIEIEIYVPLRSAISRLLVYGWRNDDLEMQFKIQELKKQSQSVFRIQKDLQSPTNWNVCCRMLCDGVGRSTLPCEKLRAIVATAHEIARLSLEEQTSMKEEHKNNGDIHNNDDTSATENNTNNNNQQQQHQSSYIKELSADDFLPIFIYCFVQAELLRPSALCVLLRTLCDPLKKIGETGYYLASFESAVSYIYESDLMEECSVATLETSSTGFLSF